MHLKRLTSSSVNASSACQDLLQARQLATLQPRCSSCILLIICCRHQLHCADLLWSQYLLPVLLASGCRSLPSGATCICSEPASRRQNFAGGRSKDRGWAQVMQKSFMGCSVLHSHLLTREKPVLLVALRIAEQIRSGSLLA